jgi:hypothetical protein
MKESKPLKQEPKYIPQQNNNEPKSKYINKPPKNFRR